MNESWASCLEWLSDQLVEAVHTHQDPAEIHRAYQRAITLTPPPGVDPVEALAVALAAQISPDRPVGLRTQWIKDMGWQLDEDAEAHDLLTRSPA